MRRVGGLNPRPDGWDSERPKSDFRRIDQRAGGIFLFFIWALREASPDSELVDRGASVFRVSLSSLYGHLMSLNIFTFRK
jgi:hypothetical protein